MNVSGDNFVNLCNVLVYERNHFNDYFKDYNINKQIIYVNENENKNNEDVIKEIKNKRNIFFTKIEYLDYFARSVMPYLEDKFILITHNGDYSSGNSEVLYSDLLVKWYGQNMNRISNKTYGIPIGLENKKWKRTNFELIKKFSKTPKTQLLYLNFSLTTNHKRREIMKNMLANGFTKNEQLPWDKYIEELSNYKFALSPEGNGCDCHRTWECLYLGVIPIVTKSKPMYFFNDLPILFVNSFNEITPAILDNVYTKIKKQDFNLEKLEISYWEKRFINDLSS